MQERSGDALNYLVGTKLYTLKKRNGAKAEYYATSKDGLNQNETVHGQLAIWDTHPPARERGGASETFLIL